MTWEELTEKAKKLGYELRFDDGDVPYFNGRYSYFLERRDERGLRFWGDGLSSGV